MEALGGMSKLLHVAWIAVLLATCALLLATVFSRRRWQSARQTPSLGLFCLLAMSMAGIGGLVFLRFGGTAPVAWHYVPLVAFVGLLIEAAVASSLEAWRPWARLLVCLPLVALSLPQAWIWAHTRRTDIDVVCQDVRSKAGPNDLILISPFYISPGFSYYYHGSARWNTVPLIPDGPDRRICPYFSMKLIMATPNAITPVLAEIEKTLSAGNRVWIVGGVLLPSPDTKFPEVPPAPHPRFGWAISLYIDVWQLQLGHYIMHHAARVHRFPFAESASLEQVPLTLVEGWQGGSSP